MCDERGMRRTMTALALAGLLGALGLPLTAWADEAAEQAKKHNAEAKKQFSLGNFSQAATLYKKAYEAKPVPEFLHNVGQCYKRMAALEYLEKALFYFESYLNNAPDSPSRADVEAEIAELKRQIQSLRRGGVRTDGGKAQPAPRDAVTPPPVPESRPRSTPIYKRWWFWTVIGAVVVGGTVGAVAATTGGSSRMPHGLDGSFNPGNYPTQ
jgi:tetratricopeptide (TPR) repeat protein